MSKDFEAEFFAHIASLKEINQRLLMNLKVSVKLRAQFKQLVSDPESFQELLDGFKEVISWADTGIVELKVHWM